MHTHNMVVDCMTSWEAVLCDTVWDGFSQQQSKVTCRGCGLENLLSSASILALPRVPAPRAPPRPAGPPLAATLADFGVV